MHSNNITATEILPRSYVKCGSESLEVFLRFHESLDVGRRYDVVASFACRVGSVEAQPHRSLLSTPTYLYIYSMGHTPFNLSYCLHLLFLYKFILHRCLQ